MSVDEVVASDVPPRYLLYFIYIPTPHVVLLHVVLLELHNMMTKRCVCIMKVQFIFISSLRSILLHVVILSLVLYLPIQQVFVDECLLSICFYLGITTW